MPLSPLSQAVHTYPLGEARRRAVITIDDYKRFAETLQIEVLNNTLQPIKRK